MNYTFKKNHAGDSTQTSFRMQREAAVHKKTLLMVLHEGGSQRKSHMNWKSQNSFLKKKISEKVSVLVFHLIQFVQHF